MPLKGLADLSTLMKMFYGAMVGISIFLSSVYVFASSYFVTVDRFSPVQESVKDNSAYIKNIFVLLKGTASEHEFKQYIYQKDIADATNNLKQYDRVKLNRELTVYENSRVEYLTKSITRWRNALENLNDDN